MKNFTLLALFLFSSLANANAQISRLVAATNYRYGANAFYIGDSTWYTYTGNNGGQAGQNIIDFTTSTDYLYDTTIDLYNPITLVQQSFDANGNIISAVYQLWDDTTQTWINNGKLLSSFDANHNDTLDVNYYYNPTSDQWFITGAIHYIFSNNAESHVSQTYDTANQMYTNTTIENDTFTNGQITSRYRGDWSGAQQTWLPDTWARWYLNSANKDSAYISLSYDTISNLWSNNVQGQFYYNNNLLGLQESEQWDATNSVWDSVYRDIYSYDAKGNDTLLVIQQYNNGWEGSNELINHYNSSNQITYNEFFQWNGNYIPYQETFYYYELYSGIDKLSNDDNDLQVYPNPASCMVYLNATMPQQQPVQVFLYNSLGQQLWSQDMGTAKSIKATVPVNNLSPGVYMVMVRQGNVMQTKQVVVQ